MLSEPFFIIKKRLLGCTKLTTEGDTLILDLLVLKFRVFTLKNRTEHKAFLTKMVFLSKTEIKQIEFLLIKNATYILPMSPDQRCGLWCAHNIRSKIKEKKIKNIILFFC